MYWVAMDRGDDKHLLDDSGLPRERFGSADCEQFWRPRASRKRVAALGALPTAEETPPRARAFYNPVKGLVTNLSIESIEP